MPLIRPIKRDELNETLKLIRSVFAEFEAPDYTPEGVETFFEFTEQRNIEQGIDAGELKFWICLDQDSIVGVISIKNSTHICMLFVDKKYHRRGIATKLVRTALYDIDDDKDITVNSSPYGAAFYHAAGFQNTDNLTILNGIKFIPMSAKCSDLKNNDT